MKSPCRDAWDNIQSQPLNAERYMERVVAAYDAEQHFARRSATLDVHAIKVYPLTHKFLNWLEQQQNTWESTALTTLQSMAMDPSTVTITDQTLEEAKGTAQGSTQIALAYRRLAAFAKTRLESGDPEEAKLPCKPVVIDGPGGSKKSWTWAKATLYPVNTTGQPANPPFSLLIPGRVLAELESLERSLRMTPRQLDFPQLQQQLEDGDVREDDVMVYVYIYICVCKLLFNYY